MYSLEYLITRKFNTIEYVSENATDSVEMFFGNEIDAANAVNTITSDSKTDSYGHPLIKKEFETQSGIIEFLKNCKTFDYDDLHFLIKLQDNNGKGSLLE